MPRKPNKFAPRGGRSGNPDEKHYFGHDDRVKTDAWPFLENRRKVSFKTQSRARDAPCSYALSCLDEDIPMATSSNNNNRQIVVRGRDGASYRVRDGASARGRNSPLLHRGFRRGSGSLGTRVRQLMKVGDHNWFKVIIPYGQKYSKEYVLRTLMNFIAPETFVPIMYKVLGNESSFYIDDPKIATALEGCDRKITVSDGFKLQVRVKPGLPQCEVDDKLKERLKQAMSKRYVQETNALDLSKFHQDPDLVTDYFCALFRPVMLKTVLDIVSEHIPNLEALNLDGNKLQGLERLNILSKKFEKLKILYLGDNRIREINQLDVLKDLKLEELRLAGNPFCNKYKSRQNDYWEGSTRKHDRFFSKTNLYPPNYSIVSNSLTTSERIDKTFLCPVLLFNDKANVSVITTNLEFPGYRLFFVDNSDVRKRFPKLLRLDGMELPKPILFDVADDAAKLPPVQRMFVANAKAQEIASQFLQQYFLIFDSGNRQPLLDAYDEHATFSMTISYPHNASKLTGYLTENRNLYRINDNNRRQKLLKCGRLPVVSFISQMPQTTHYLNTFTMDITLVTEGMMLVTVTGFFKEMDKDQTIRYFNRTFIIVPEGSGYCIRNEQLHLNQPTDAQSKSLNSQPFEARMPPATVSTVPPPAIVKPPVAQLPEDVKQQMTLTLSQQTNMNLEWSLKCLEEVQWNYDNAVAAFQEFFKRGQIPAEAFNK